MSTDVETDSSTGSPPDVSSPDDIVNSFTSVKQKRLAKKQSRSLMKKEKEKRKKKSKNKISTGDYYNKSLEFKAWLSETKKLDADALSPRRSRELFQKFVKKWNSKKLPKHLYRGVDALWVVGSPLPASPWKTPQTSSVPASPGGYLLDTDYARTPPDEANFATFGKKTGSRFLQRLLEYNKKMAAAESSKDTAKSASPIYATPVVTPSQSSDKKNKITGDYSEVSMIALESNIPTQDTPEYLGMVSRRHRPQTDTDTATIAAPWSVYRSSRTLSRFNIAEWQDSQTDGVQTSDETPQLNAEVNEQVVVEVVPEVKTEVKSEVNEVQKMENSSRAQNNEELVKKPKKTKRKKVKKTGASGHKSILSEVAIYDEPIPFKLGHDVTENTPPPSDCAADTGDVSKKARPVSKQDSYLTRIENTSNVMYESVTVGKKQRVEQRTPVRSTNPPARSKHPPTPPKRSIDPPTPTMRSSDSSHPPTPPVRSSKLSAKPVPPKRTSNHTSNDVPTTLVTLKPLSSFLPQPDGLHSVVKHEGDQVVLSTPSGVFLVKKLDGVPTNDGAGEIEDAKSTHSIPQNGQYCSLDKLL